MINLDCANNQTNAELLLKGIWYSNLPDIIDIDELTDDIRAIFTQINNKTAPEYIQEEDGFISDWKTLISPPYVRSPGVEAITFYDFKKDKSLREMQIPNLLHHISFMYNTLIDFENIFEKLYIDEDNAQIVENSNSYLVFEDTFLIYSYNNEEEWGISGMFTTNNNKIHSSAMLSANKRRVLAVEADYLYSLKMDIESFFPSLYTHNFEKMASKQPYVDLDVDERYFSFLDRFHQRINNNQTKGIPAGIFSSHVAAELCMLCVDYEIREYIDNCGQSIGYIRYVDDLTFYSDTQSALMGIFPATQKILNKYRLRINGSKTEALHTALATQPAYLSEIERLFPFLAATSDSYELSLADYYDLQKYIAECLANKRPSQVRSLLSIIRRRLDECTLYISSICNELFYYLLKLVFEDETLTSHIFQIIDLIIPLSPTKYNVTVALWRKRAKIDNEYPDTLLQIWYYYVLFKHCDDAEKQNLLDSIEEKNYNPLIIACMVVPGKGNNRQLFNYIKNTYSKDTQSEGAEWKKHIMYSKWWLPLFKIKRYDEHNYESFMCSNNFPQTLKGFSPHVDVSSIITKEDLL